MDDVAPRPQKRDEHLVQEYLRAATPARCHSIAHGTASHDAMQKNSSYVDRLPQTEQKCRGAAVVGGPTAAVRYDGTPAGRASRFACAYAGSSTSYRAFGRQLQRRLINLSRSVQHSCVRRERWL